VLQFSTVRVFQLVRHVDLAATSQRGDPAMDLALNMKVLHKLDYNAQPPLAVDSIVLSFRGILYFFSIRFWQ
jgi:hypothetical protein